MFDFKKSNLRLLFNRVDKVLLCCSLPVLVSTTVQILFQLHYQKTTKHCSAVSSTPTNLQLFSHASSCFFPPCFFYVSIRSFLQYFLNCHRDIWVCAAKTNNYINKNIVKCQECVAAAG